MMGSLCRGHYQKQTMTGCYEKIPMAMALWDIRYRSSTMMQDYLRKMADVWNRYYEPFRYHDPFVLLAIWVALFSIR